MLRHALLNSFLWNVWQVEQENPQSVERRNSSDKSILSLGGMRRLSTNFKCRRKKEGVRQEVREVEGESKAKRNAHMNMNMWMG